MVPKAQKYEVKMIAARTSGTSKIILAADCGAFVILRTGRIFFPAALQALENRKVSCEPAPCGKTNLLLPFRPCL